MEKYYFEDNNSYHKVIKVVEEDNKEFYLTERFYVEDNIDRKITNDCISKDTINDFLKEVEAMEYYMHYILDLVYPEEVLEKIQYALKNKNVFEQKDNYEKIMHKLNKYFEETEFYGHNFKYFFDIKFLYKTNKEYYYIVFFIENNNKFMSKIIKLDYELPITIKENKVKLVEKYIFDEKNCVSLRVTKEDEEKYYAVEEKIKEGKLNILSDTEIEKDDVIEIDKSHYYASVVFSKNLDELYDNLKYLEKNKIDIDCFALVDFYENEDYELIITRTDLGNKILIQLNDANLSKEDKNKYSFAIKDKLNNLIYDIEE